MAPQHRETTRRTQPRHLILEKPNWEAQWASCARCNARQAAYQSWYCGACSLHAEISGSSSAFTSEAMVKSDSGYDSRIGEPSIVADFFPYGNTNDPSQPRKTSYLLENLVADSCGPSGRTLEIYQYQYDAGNNDSLYMYQQGSPIMDSYYTTSSWDLGLADDLEPEGFGMQTDTQHTMSLSPSPSSAADGLTPTSRPREKFPCLEVECGGKSFSRQADLQRHYDHVHRLAEAAQKGHCCDYPRCGRQHTPFHRKDHFRDHLREFHKEDLLKRNGHETTQWFQERNINPDFWRCGSCLRRNSVEKRGYICFKCNNPCDQKRVEHRQRAAFSK